MEDVGREGHQGWEIGIGGGEANLESEHGRSIGAFSSTQDDSISRWTLFLTSINIPERTKSTLDQSVGSPGVRLT